MTEPATPGTVRDLIVQLLDMPMDAEIEVLGPEMNRARRIVDVSAERPGASPHGLAYVTLELSES